MVMCSAVFGAVEIGAYAGTTFSSVWAYLADIKVAGKWNKTSARRFRERAINLSDVPETITIDQSCVKTNT